MIGEGWGWGFTETGGQQTNIKITKQIQLDLLERNNFQYKITNMMSGGTDNKNMWTNTQREKKQTLE